MPSLYELQQRGDIEVPSNMGVEEKEALAAAGTPFDIVKVALGEGSEYGGFWQVDIELEGRARSFALNLNENRDPLMETLASFTAVEPVTNCKLVVKSRRGGNAFLMIDPASSEEAPKSK